VSFDLISLILQAGLIVKLVLLLLLAFSIASLAIIVTKWWELRAADQDSEAFLEVYQRAGFREAYDAARHLDRSPLAVVFLTTGGALQSARERNATDQSSGQLLTKLERSIAWGAAGQARRLERGLPFLATTGSTAPFIGLFGTVIGIIAAFQSIGEAGQASLAVVGPGIAEALVATAIGLLTAIPAMMAYNAFGGRIDGIIAMLDRFTVQFEEDIQRLVRIPTPQPVSRSDVDHVASAREF
jgi:biopolymer transport protein TolQ